MTADPFIATRTKLAKEAAARDALAAHSEQVTYWLNPASRVGAAWQPQTYATTTLDDVCRTAARAASGRVNLAARRREHMQGQRNLDLRNHGRYGMLELLDLRTLAAIAAIDRAHRLTAQGRKLVRLVRDTETRAALAAQGDTYPMGTPWAPADDAVDAAAAVAAETPSSSRPWRGIIPTTETRVSPRGAYGDQRGRGKLKVVPGLVVSTRDNRVPTWALRNLATVGLATVPGVTEWGAAHVTELMEWVRRDRKRATLRTWLPVYDVATHAPIMRDVVTYATDYAPADAAYLDAAGRTQHHALRGGIPQHEADMTRQRMTMQALAERGSIGYIGDVG